MGVPAFFVYLVKKYPDIMIDLEPRSPSETEEEYFYRVGEEYATAIACDNLYLDCNGIIHPCCHPEGGQPQPKTEDEMFANVAALIDSIVELVRPKRVLYLAIDGVAPRAKMNQQRSRRFRSAKETAEKTAASAVVRAQFAREGLAEPPTPPPSWDRNVITPGTPFMERLARFLRHYVATRIESHPLWRGLGVVLSDAGVPGEGEHKLIEFIRTQRTQPGYDPLTRHVLMGEDADLIMLALATHEINFSILRERRFMKRNQCFKCGSFGHSSYQCKAPPPAEKPFSLLSVAVLRQWLQQDFEGMMIEGVDGSSEAFARADFERYVDDFVFLCFFVGNDFLPHAPALDIRDGSLELLMRLYKEIAPEHGYITNSGAVLWDGLRPLLRRIAEVEPQMLKKKLAKAKRNAKYNRNRGGGRGGNRKYSKTRGGKQRCHAFDRGGCAYGDRCKFAHGDAGGAPPRERCFFFDRDGTCRNGDSCRFAHGPDAEVAAPPPPTPEEEAAASTAAFKNRLKDLLEESEAQEIKLALDRERQGMSSGMGEGGYAERFYSVKFRGGAPAPTPTPESSASGAAGDDLVANPRGVPAGLIESYLEGLCWVLSYYYNGVHTGRWCAFNWAFPFHYAPFAADIAAFCDSPGFQPPKEYEPAAAVLAARGITRDEAVAAAGGADAYQGAYRTRGTPFLPLMQLMAVLPAASAHCLPTVCQELMANPDSPLRSAPADMYPGPADLVLDPNGQQRKWQWVVLLPWLNEARLRGTFAERVVPALDAGERRRNALGHEEMWLHASHPAAAALMLGAEAATAAETAAGVVSLDVKFEEHAWAAATGVSGTLVLEGKDGIPLERDLEAVCAQLGFAQSAAPSVVRTRWTMPYERPHLCARLPTSAL